MWNNKNMSVLKGAFWLKMERKTCFSAGGEAGSYLQPQDVQHFSLLPLTWPDVPLREVIMPGEDPLDLSGAGGRGGAQSPGRGAQSPGRGAQSPGPKSPHHAALVTQMPARRAGAHRPGQEQPPGLGAALHLWRRKG